jgi:hypothetical protein
MTGKRNCLRVVCLAITLFSALCFVQSVSAVGNIRIGRLNVEPGIKYKGEANDNIYSARTNETDDFIHKITPGVTFKYKGATPGNFFDFGYSVDIVAYSDFDDNNYESHNPFIRFGIDTPAGFFIKFDDAYQDTSDPYGAANNYGLGSKTERWNNTANFILGYKFAGKYSIEGLYKNYAEGFDLARDSSQDRKDHIYGASFVVKVTGKTSLFGQYRRTDAEYDTQNDGINMVPFGGTSVWNSNNSQDYNLNDFFLGARFDPGGKLSGEIKLGWGDKNFENRVDKDLNTYKDSDSFIAETRVSFKASERMNLNLNLQRSLVGSPDADSSSYIDTTFGLAIDHAFIPERLIGKLGTEWNTNDYQDEFPGKAEKSFDTFTFTAGLDYNIKEWLSAGVGYEYKDKEASNTYEASEYTSNIFSVMLSAMF